MNRKEYNKWVQQMQQEYACDKSVIEVVLEDNKMLINKVTAKTEILDKYYSTKELAIAYAKLKDIEIPDLVEEPQRWRAEKHCSYYYIDSNLCTMQDTDENDLFDKCLFIKGNYFKTAERAKEVAEKIKFILKLEQLHDLYCPDYKPDWSNDDESKYRIYYSHRTNEYGVSHATICENFDTVYFPDKEIALKVCSILNEEKSYVD